jgi:hypothetical protein
MKAGKRARFGRAAIGLAVVVSLGVVRVPSVEGGSRGVERLLEKQGVSSSDRAGIDRALKAADRAGFPERDAERLVEVCLEGEFPAAEVVRVLSLATQLTLQNLPTESFVAKIAEGVAKRVSPEKVLAAAERRALLLNQAQNLLNGILLEGSPVRDREELIPDVAEALEDGRSAGELRELLTSSFKEGEGIREIRQKIFH